jgi:hypothetical protein
LRHRLIDSAGTPCRRAAPAITASPASTTRNRLSTGTRSFDLLRSFPPSKFSPKILPESLTQTSTEATSASRRYQQPHRQHFVDVENASS